MPDTFTFRTVLWKLPLLLVLFIALGGCVKEAPPAPPVLYPNYQYGAVGSAATDLLTEKMFTSLAVEIQYMNGFQPEAESIQHLQQFLQRYTNKPNGVSVSLSAIAPADAKQLHVEQVRSLEKQHRQRFPVDKTLTLYVLITNGRHTDGNFLGMAYANTSAVLFGGAIQKNSGQGNILTKAELETAVLLHEMGHLMGLGISSSTTPANGDKKSHYHCENELCLMYRTTETRNLSVIDQKGKIPSLDEQCLQRLRAYSQPPVQPTSAPLLGYKGITSAAK